MLQTTVSFGDLLVLAGFGVHVMYNYFGVVRRVDRVVLRHEGLEQKFEELRRGRGLILESFPPMVRRCFGYGAQAPQADEQI